MEAVRSHASSWMAVYFSFSKLKHYNQSDVMLEDARMVIQKCLGGQEFKIFNLTNYDTVVFIQNIGLLKIEGMILDIRKVFQGDPLVQKGTGQENFYKTYPLSHSFNELSGLIDQARHSGHKSGVDYSEEIPLTSTPMLPFETLVKLQGTLRSADISNFIRRQNLYAATSTTSLKKIGCEYFLSLEGIENVIEAESHIINDFALFKYLSVLFDKKMLVHLSAQLKHLDPALDVRINLNMRSIVSKEFAEFHKKISPRRVTIEVDRTDVLWDQDGFNFGVDFLKSYKHQISLDLLTGPNLKFFTGMDIMCDSYKVIADTDLFEYYGDDLKAFIEHVGADKIVFARCESPRALEEGLAYGVTLYQGRYLDQQMSGKN